MPGSSGPDVPANGRFAFANIESVAQLPRRRSSGAFAIPQARLAARAWRTDGVIQTGR